MKKIWHWLSKIFWEISKACALMECSWYCQELRKEILSWDPSKKQETKKEKK